MRFLAWLGLAGALLAGVPAGAGAQGCCTPGSAALGGLTGGALLSGNVELGLAAEGYSLRQAYRGSESVADPADRHSRVLTNTIYARLGIHARIGAIVRLPFEYRAREQTVVFGSQRFQHEFENAALGDLSTLVMARLLPLRGFAAWSVQLGAGVKWATGPDDATQDGLALPVELQTGTGSTDPLLALAASRSGSRFSFLGAALARFPTAGRSGYEYGNELQVSLVGLWNWRTTFVPALEVRGRMAGRDRFEGREARNTGGIRWMSGLRLSKEFPQLRLGLEAAFLLPFYHDMNGLQLGVDRQLGLNVRWQVR